MRLKKMLAVLMAFGLMGVAVPFTENPISEPAVLSASAYTDVTDCEIANSAYTFTTSKENEIFFGTLLPPFNATIYGYENSSAQAYAEKYNRSFRLIDSSPQSETTRPTTEPAETTRPATYQITEPPYTATTSTKSTTIQPVAPAENMTWNGVNPDINRDGSLDAKDASLLLVYAAEFGAGNIKSFAEFMDKNYS